MKALVREAMRQGALGVSTSLMYPPGRTRRPKSSIALAAEAAIRRYLRDAHAVEARRRAPGARRGHPHRPRSEHPGRDLAPEGGRQGELGPHAGDLAKIEQARRDGVDITADTYAYPAWFNSLSPSFRPGRTTAATPSSWRG